MHFPRGLVKEWEVLLLVIVGFSLFVLAAAMLILCACCSCRFLGDFYHLLYQAVYLVVSLCPGSGQWWCPGEPGWLLLTY